MPIIKSAKKKQRRDKIREKQNNLLRNLSQKTVRLARKNPAPEKVSKATKILDKLAKRRIIHKNKAARIKSSLSKLIKVGKLKPKQESSK